MKKRILVCVGTRADAIKSCPLYLALKERDDCEALLLNCGQHAEMTDGVLAYFGVSADYSLSVMERGREPDATADAVRERVLALLGEISPDLMIVQGDTASSLGCAEAGAAAGIPVAHIEAGLRTCDETDPWPEEGYRVRISALASLHFAPTEKAKKNLLAEGVEENVIFVVGNTVTDALRRELEQPHEPCAEIRALDHSRGVALLTCHRRENLTERDGRIGAMEIFSAARRLLKEHPELKIVFPIHKNERVRELWSRAGVESDRLILCEPLDYPSLVYLLSRATLVLSDSGGIVEEATCLGTPTVIARDRTERPEAVERGTAVLAGRDRERIYTLCADIIKNTPPADARGFSPSVFGDGRVSERIADILMKK